MAAVAAASVVFALSSFSVSNDGVWLRLLKPLTGGLEPIAAVTEVRGAARRKTAVDSLWLPLRDEAVVYDGDLISTGEQGLLEITLGPELRLSVEPSSLLRMRKVAGQPLIQLSRGYLKTHSLSDQTVLIQRGGKVEGVLIRKGTFLIRNDDAIGVQITAFADDVKIASGAEPKRSRAKARARETGSETEKELGDDARAENLKIEGPLPDMEPLPTEYELPVPRNKTHFLIRGAGEILIAARTSCKETCGLTVERDRKLWLTKTFGRSELSAVRLSGERLQTGHYEWTFVSGPDRLHGEFQVESYSSEAMDRALKADAPVEIL